MVCTCHIIFVCLPYWLNVGGLGRNTTGLDAAGVQSIACCTFCFEFKEEELIHMNAGILGLEQSFMWNAKDLNLYFLFLVFWIVSYGIIQFLNEKPHGDTINRFGRQGFLESQKVANCPTQVNWALARYLRVQFRCLADTHNSLD